LLSLVISETLRGNRLNGILIALAPMMTDLPIVLVSIFLLKTVSGSDILLGIISIAGGIFLMYLGIKNLTFSNIESNSSGNYVTSIRYGIITNFLSPHPYIFWITVGAPTFIKASEIESLQGYVFITGFYLLLIGSKIVLAIVTGFFNHFLSGKTYSILMKLIGLIIIAYAFLMIYDGIGPLL